MKIAIGQLQELVEEIVRNRHVLFMILQILVLPMDFQLWLRTGTGFTRQRNPYPILQLHLIADRTKSELLPLLFMLYP